MRPIQHKREAYWFYFVVSRVYDRWVNPLFWTPAMRTQALDLARLGPGLDVVDVGAGTGFASEEIVERAHGGGGLVRHQSVSIFRTERKIATAATSRSGNRN